MARRERLPAKREPPNGQMPAVRPPVLWYLILMLILLWIWQDALRQVSMHTIPYSEFKSRLARGEVSDCTIEQVLLLGPHMNLRRQSSPRIARSWTCLPASS